MDRRLVAVRSGQLAPAIAVLSIGSAVALAPTFSFTSDALSDLGVPGTATAPVFNVGLILASLVGLPFCLYLFAERTDLLGRFGAALLTASLLALAGVGTFPSGTSLHLPAAIGFYLLATYGIATIGTARLLAETGTAGLLGVWTALAILSAWLLWGIAVSQGFPGGLALPETVGALLVAGWIFRTATRMSGAENRDE